MVRKKYIRCEIYKVFLLSFWKVGNSTINNMMREKLSYSRKPFFAVRLPVLYMTYPLKEVCFHLFHLKSGKIQIREVRSEWLYHSVHFKILKRGPNHICCLYKNHTFIRLIICMLYLQLLILSALVFFNAYRLK